MRERIPIVALQIFVFFCISFPREGRSQPSSPPLVNISGTAQAPPKVCQACIRAQMEFLASDALRGRGSGTPDEFVAATYVAAQLRQYGIKPAGDNGGYIQRGVIIRQKFIAPPELHFAKADNSSPDTSLVWTYGKQMLAIQLNDNQFRGPLKKVEAENLSSSKPDFKGSVVAIFGKDEKQIENAVEAALTGGARAVLAPASERRLKHWETRARELPGLATRIQGEESAAFAGEGNLFALRPEATTELRGLPEGTLVEFDGPLGPVDTSYTWNAVGELAGRDPALRKSALLLTAHLDHLGIGKPVNGDDIYNGADDDASGTTAVLELARTLGSGAKPRRTVIFALFGSEEAGVLGSTWFEAHPPVPLADIAANLEFEMIGRPDPKYAKDALWLTGWERSNLGPALAAHGARLVPDRRLNEQFFMRSDNYVLAKKGVVAQTVSSFGLHSDYHQPSDDLAHIDFRHMTAAIGSLIAPIEWLANSDFRPQWKKGQQP